MRMSTIVAIHSPEKWDLTKSNVFLLCFNFGFRLHRKFHKNKSKQKYCLASENMLNMVEVVERRKMFFTILENLKNGENRKLLFNSTDKK